jgi:hypothetical protein
MTIEDIAILVPESIAQKKRQVKIQNNKLKR